TVRIKLDCKLCHSSLRAASLKYRRAVTRSQRTLLRRLLALVRRGLHEEIDLVALAARHRLRHCGRMGDIERLEAQIRHALRPDASTGLVFWQYVIATIFALPLILRIGLGKLRTRHPVLHEIRAFVSAAGVQVFAFGFASGVPVWQMVALSMTAPFFIIFGSILFLGEKVTRQRVLATLVGFAGALLVAGVGTGGFSWFSVLPVIATALWATANLLTKHLAKEGESAESLTLYMLVLITPNHLLIGLLLGVAVSLFPGALPASLANGFDFGLPGGTAFWLIVLLGLITAGSQYLNSLAY